MRRATRALAWLVCVATAAVGWPCLAAEKMEVDFRENVEYGTGAGETLFLHLAVPKGLTEAAPGLLLIHGGGWQGGDKNSFKKVCQEAAAAGYVAASVGYRFAPKHPFPAQVEDCKCAVRWLRAHAAELNLDPSRIGAVGASAGAHLAMMLGTMDSSDGLEGAGGWADQSSKVQCVVSYFGPTNLTYLDLSQNPSRKYISEPIVRSILEKFVGGKAEEHATELKQASPITYVNAGDAPMLLFQGTIDPLVPYDQATQMANALTEAKVPGRVEILLGRGHGWGGEEMERTQEVTFTFLDEILRPADDK